MADQPVTLSVLAQFHREVILPDVERVVRAAVNDLRIEFSGHFDAIYQRFERLETEYHMLVEGLRRVEDRMDGVETRLGRVETRLGGVETRLDAVETRLGAVDKGLAEVASGQHKFALRTELQDLKRRVELLQGQIQAIEERLAD